MLNRVAASHPETLLLTAPPSFADRHEAEWIKAEQVKRAQRGWQGIACRLTAFPLFQAAPLFQLRALATRADVERPSTSGTSATRPPRAFTTSPPTT